MNNMKPREKALFALTAAAVAIFAIWTLFLEDSVDSGAVGGGGGDVAVLERRFQENIRALEEIYIIESEFSRIGELPGTEEDASGRRLSAAVAFQEQVAEMCRQNGFDFPGVRTDREEIRGVEDYELINVGLTVEGPFERCMNLLKTFESAGLMFRDVTIRASRDRDQLRVDTVVARIAERPPTPTGADRLRR